MSNLNIQFKIDANIPDHWNTPPVAKSYQPKKNFTPLRQSQQDAISFLIEKLTLKAYSSSTFKSYKGHLVSLLIFHNKIEPIDIQDDNVEQYLLHCIKTKKISESTQNQIINAYKAYAELVLKRSRVFIQIIRPKKPKTLPNVLSKEEVIRLIDCIDNLKHKLIILLVYSAGLRRSEAIQMRVRDVSFERNQIFIKSAKGKKDRYVVLAKIASQYLKLYIKQYAPAYWMFEGVYSGQYSATSIHNIFQRAKDKSDINPFSTLHTLRHSYATHCLEDGHSIKLVQEALGHGSIKTTERYLHVTTEALIQLKSPLDNLEIK